MLWYRENIKMKCIFFFIFVDWYISNWNQAITFIQRKFNFMWLLYGHVLKILFWATAPSYSFCSLDLSSHNLLDTVNFCNEKSWYDMITWTRSTFWYIISNGRYKNPEVTQYTLPWLKPLCKWRNCTRIALNKGQQGVFLCYVKSYVKNLQRNSKHKSCSRLFVRFMNKYNTSEIGTRFCCG